MIVVRGLSKRFGPQELFSEVNLELLPGERYGLVGANGSGKSTFLRILMGDEAHDDGSIVMPPGTRLGVLRQDRFADDTQVILDAAMGGDEEVHAALTELHTDHGGDSSPDRAERIAELSDFVAARDGYTLETRAREILVGLGIPSGQLKEPLSTLSGGFKLRVLLGKVLVGRPSVLLLDEPTNHLDILSIRWLEQFLQTYAGTAVIISHDRRFLERATTRTLDVDYGTITAYLGAYSAFLVAKAAQAERRQAEADKAEKIIAEKRAFVERFGAKATKAKQAQSRLKQIEKIEVATVLRTTRRAPLFRFQEEKATGKDVLTIEQLKKSYGDKVVLKDLNLMVRRGERVAIIGENGIGKSTLLKILAHQLDPDSGKWAFGANAKVGYFAQDHHDLLSDPNLTPLEYVYSAVPTETVSYVRGELGRMLFSGQDVEKKAAYLSGGEAARLVFARITVEKPNILLLDEPTNHLDLESIEALAEALNRYEGTLLFVSHDRWFVSQVATRIVELCRDKTTDFPGTFEEYLSQDGHDHLDSHTVSLKAKAEKAETRALEARAGDSLSYEERKRRANRRKALPKRRDEILQEIEALEVQKTAAAERYELPGYFETTTPADQKKHADEAAALEERIGRLMTEWEQVEQEIESLGTD